MQADKIEEIPHLFLESHSISALVATQSSEIIEAA
jgi:hypothetical protein